MKRFREKPQNHNFLSPSIFPVEKHVRVMFDCVDKFCNLCMI